MAKSNITYDDKELGQANPLPDVKKWKFQDANEVKDIVNSNANAFKFAVKTYVNSKGSSGGEVGNYFAPFATPTEAAEAIRQAAISNSIMIIQAGTYVAEDLFWDGGIILCEEDVVSLQTGDNKAMFENIDGSYDGIDFKILGKPDLVEVGSKKIIDMTTPINYFGGVFGDFTIGASSVFSTNLRANKVDFVCRDFVAILIYTNVANISMGKCSRRAIIQMVDDSTDANLVGNFNIYIEGIYAQLSSDGIGISSTATVKGQVDFRLGYSPSQISTGIAFNYWGNANYNLYFKDLYSTSIIIGYENEAFGSIINVYGKIHGAIVLSINSNDIFNLVDLELIGDAQELISPTSSNPETVNVIGSLTLITTANPKISPDITLVRISEPDQIPIAGTGMSINLANPHQPIYTSLTSTSAGTSIRVWFTGDEVVLSETFYLSNGSGKGTVPTIEQIVVVNDNQTLWFAQDIIGNVSTEDYTVPAGSYSAVISAGVDSNSGEQRFQTELYITDANGVPIDSPDLTSPIGDLGVRILVLLDSGFIDMLSGNETQVYLSGSINNSVVIPTNHRVRYHTSGTKVNSAGGSVDLSFFIGSDHNSFLDAPFSGVEEAPIDGQLYGRKDGAWEVIP